MKEYRINIKPDLDDNYSNIVKDYWEIKQEIFINKPKTICSNYNITFVELNSIIKKYSSCTIIYGECSNCGVVLEDNVYSQTSFNETKRYSIKDRCLKCDVLFLKDFKVKKSLQLEEEELQIENNFNQAIKDEKWNELSGEEFEILKMMIQLKDKSLIYKNVFNGNAYDKSVWMKVKNIENLGLVFILRAENRHIIDFLFPKDLEEILLKKEILNEELNHLSFSISKNINKKNVRQPDYSGSFILKLPVKLDKDVKYTYGGWINIDGSISLTFKPVDDLFKKVEQSEMVDKPAHIRTIASDFFNQIEQDNFDE